MLVSFSLCSAIKYFDNVNHVNIEKFKNTLKDEKVL